MKQLFFFCIPMFCFLAACNLCDPSSDDNPEQSRYVGTFKLTAWNAPVAVDIDQNGTGSRNLMLESACYQPSKIILSSNRTYVKHEHYPEMESMSCGATTTSGNWTAYGNTLMLISSDGNEEVYDYGEVNQILTRSETNWSYPIVNGSEGTYATGDVNMVFTKQ